MNKKFGILFVALVILFAGIAISIKNHSMQAPTSQQSASEEKILSGSFDTSKMKSDPEWRKILTPAQFHILREQGTEVPFTGALEYEKRKGTYYSAGCNEPVFRSEQKYDSGTGWPSFTAPINSDALVLREDNNVPGEPRIEVLDKCGGH